MPEADSYVDLVFEGGGVKGIGLAGAWEALEAENYRPRRVAGTSAGAITAPAPLLASFGLARRSPIGRVGCGSTSSIPNVGHSGVPSRSKRQIG